MNITVNRHGTLSSHGNAEYFRWSNVGLLDFCNVIGRQRQRSKERTASGVKAEDLRLPTNAGGWRGTDTIGIHEDAPYFLLLLAFVVGCWLAHSAITADAQYTSWTLHANAVGSCRVEGGSRAATRVTNSQRANINIIFIVLSSNNIFFNNNGSHFIFLVFSCARLLVLLLSLYSAPSDGTLTACRLRNTIICRFKIRCYLHYYYIYTVAQQRKGRRGTKKKLLFWWWWLI